MGWKECDRVSERREFVSLASAEGANVAALCRRFGVSRKTGYKWLARYWSEGEAGLVDRSRRPGRFRSPTPPEIEQRVLAVRHEHPAWGGRKIHARLKQLRVRRVPAPSTITAILHRQGLIDPEQSAQREPVRRFERATPNELWQMDFKGEFRMSDGQWCYPLTVLDDHSRYALGLRACGDRQRGTVQDQLRNIFRRYGLPRAMLMDNGGPWGVPQVRNGYTRLTVWLLRLDVRVIHGRPYHPQTQGKEERFHRTLQSELLQGRQFDDLTDVQHHFDPWREMYNHERPHEALQMEVPAARYRISARVFPEQLPSYEYDCSYAVRSVDCQGRVHFQGHTLKISEAFGGQRVGLCPTREDGVWDVYFCHHRIARVDLSQRNPQVCDRPRGLSASARYARSSGQPPGKP